MRRLARKGLGSILMLTLAALAAGSGFAAEPEPIVEIIEVPGTGTTLHLWTDVDESGATEPYYRVQRADGTFSRARATRYEIALRRGHFDPRGPGLVPAVPDLLAAAEDVNLYLVQFHTPPMDAFRDAIRELGGRVSFYVPHHAHLVRMTPDVRAAVEALPFVRWVGALHPADRMEEVLVDAVAIADTAWPTLRYNVMVVEPGQQALVARAIEQMDGIVVNERAGKHLLEATLSADQLRRVARLDEVLFIDRWGPLEPDMEKARTLGGADFIEDTAGFTGQGVRGEIMDVGFNLAHVDFNANPLIQHTSVSGDSHGASTSGIIFGDGSGNPVGRGMLPDGQGIVASTSHMERGARYDHTGELVQSPFNAVFQSASVGSPQTTSYTTISAEMDAALFDFDFVICQSQSNQGDQDSRPQAWAKNIISVGGVRHHDSLDRSDDNWGGGASTGPASDGRTKPDLCHFYDSIFTVTDGSPTAYTPGFGGTSGATPIVAGHVGLFFQMWAEGVFQNPIDPTGTVFDNRSHMTTAKAMLINTASQYDWTAGGPNADITRFRQGWGMPDLRSLYERRNQMLIVDETDILTNTQSIVYTVEVVPGGGPLKATLVYADPPGAPFSSIHRINDLSLRVTGPSGTVYWGNYGLKDGPWSQVGGEADTIDTVENVFIETPHAGQWLIEVLADEINEDGHVETFASLDADFALVVSGVEENVPPFTIRLLESLPALVPPATPLEVSIEITPGMEEVVASTLHYRFDAGGPFQTAPLVDLGGGDFLATVPGAACGSTPSFYVSAEGSEGTVLSSPPNAPDSVFAYGIGEIVTTFEEDFETDTGWIVENIELDDGGWDRGVPAGGGDRGDPAVDADGSGSCYLTDNEDGNSDVDGGPTILTSPRILLSGLPDPYIEYSRWFYNDDQDSDRLLVQISGNDGGTWQTLESVGHDPTWRTVQFRVWDSVPGATEIRLRFSATDNPNDSVTEAAVDAIHATSFVCEGTVVGDVDGDGVVDFGDLLEVLSLFGPCPSPCPADLDGNGLVDFQDLLVVLSNWGG